MTSPEGELELLVSASHSGVNLYGSRGSAAAGTVQASDPANGGITDSVDVVAQGEPARNIEDRNDPDAPEPPTVRYPLVFEFLLYRLIGWLPMSGRNQVRDFQEKKLIDVLRYEIRKGKCKFCCKVLHIVVVLLIIVLTSVLQILLCMRRDTINIHRHGNKCNQTVPHPNNCSKCIDGLTEFIIPDILILFAYITSFFVVLKKQGYIWYLVEKLCEYSYPNEPQATRKEAGRKMGIQVGIGVGWLLFSLLVSIFRIVARTQTIHNTPPMIYKQQDSSTRQKLIGLEILCSGMFLVFDLVYITIIIDYSFQCQLLIDIVNRARVRLKPTRMDSIETTIRAIEDVKSAMYNQLNRYTSWNVSTMMFIFTISLLYGLIALAELGPIEGTNSKLQPHDHDNRWVLASTLLNMTQWLAFLMIPLVQAARLTSACESLKAVSLKPCSLNVDRETKYCLREYRLYITSLSLQAKLVGLPVTPGVVAGVLFVVSCALVVLIQTNFFSWTPNTL